MRGSSPRTIEGGVDSPTGKVAEVTWEDSHTSHGWRAEALALPEPGEMLSIGYVIQDDEHGVVLCESWDGTADAQNVVPSRYGCQTAIPRSAIRKVKYLRGKS